MENIDLNREQPLSADVVFDSSVVKDAGQEKLELTDLNNLVDDNVVENKADAGGSLLGKFKDAKSLMQAYANLQSEFTRKSQRLKELEKQDNFYQSNKTDFARPENLNKEAGNETSVGSSANVENGLSVNSESESKNANDKNLESDVPLNEKSVSEFLVKNPLAKHFAKEITEEILCDNDLKQSKNSLEIAMSRVLAKKYRFEQDLANDEVFLNNYVLSNDKITKRVVLNYLNGLQKHVAPPVISGASGTVSLSPFDKPKNLDDARVIVEKMLKK